MARKFEKSYRIRESDDVLEKSNKFLQDVDQRLDAIERIADQFREGNRADVDALIKAINDTIALRSAEIQALIDEQAGGFTPDRIIETALKRFTSDDEITEITDALTAVIEADGQKAPLQSPALTGTPTAPTPAPTTATAQIATTAFVRGLFDLLTEAVGQKQASSALLSAFSGVAAAENRIPLFTGPNAMSSIALSAFAQSLLDDESAAAMIATLALLPVQSSTSDATANRLLRSGAWGLGSTALLLTSANDLDTLVDNTGFYNWGSDLPSHAPLTFCGLINIRRNPATGMQICLPFNANPIRWRYHSAGAWSAWHILPLQTVGSVSQSGGVATGAVIERGSNANGEYVRFADGTQICISPAITVAMNIAAGNMFWSNGMAQNFPANFVGPVAGFGAMENTINGWVNPRVGASLWSFAAFTHTSRSSDIVRLGAIGRWF